MKVILVKEGKWYTAMMYNIIEWLINLLYFVGLGKHKVMLDGHIIYLPRFISKRDFDAVEERAKKLVLLFEETIKD